MTRHNRSHTCESDSTGSSTEVDRTPQPTWRPAFKECHTSDSGPENASQSPLDGLGISTPTVLSAQSPPSSTPSPRNTIGLQHQRPTPSHSPTSTRPGHSRRASRISVSTKGHSRGTSVASSSGPLDAFPSQESLSRVVRAEKRESFTGMPYKQPSFSFNESFLFGASTTASHSRTHSEASSASSNDVRHQSSVLPAIDSHLKKVDESRRRSTRDTNVHSRRPDSQSSLISLENDPDDDNYAAYQPRNVAASPPEASVLEQRSMSLPGGAPLLRAQIPAPLPPGFTILLDQALGTHPHDIFPRRESAPLPTLLARRAKGAKVVTQSRDDSPLLIDSPPDRSSHCLDAPMSPAPEDQHAVDPYSEINWTSFIESGYSMSFAPGAAVGSPLAPNQNTGSTPKAVVVNMERGYSDESTASRDSRSKHRAALHDEQTNFIDTSFPASDNEDSVSETGYEDAPTVASAHPAAKALEPTGIAWLDEELMDDQSPYGSPVSVGLSNSPLPRPSEVDDDAGTPWMTPPEVPAKLFDGPPMHVAQPGLTGPAYGETQLRPRHKQAQRLGLGLNVHKANHNPAALALRKLSPITPPPRTALPAIPGPPKHALRARGASISFSPSHNASSHFPDVGAFQHSALRRPSTGPKPAPVLRNKDSFQASKRQSELDLFAERSPIPEEVPEKGVIQLREPSPRAQTSLGFSQQHLDDEVPLNPAPIALQTRDRSDTIRSLPPPVLEGVVSPISSTRPLRNPNRPSSSDTAKSSRSSAISHKSGGSSAKSLKREKRSKEALEAFLANPPAVSGRNASLTKYSKMMGSDVAGATPPRRSLLLPTTTEPTPADRAANLRRLRLMGEETISTVGVKEQSATRSRSGSASSATNPSMGAVGGATQHRPAKMKDRLSVLLSAPTAAAPQGQSNSHRSSATSFSSSSGSSGSHSSSQHITGLGLSSRPSSSRRPFSPASLEEQSVGSLASSGVSVFADDMSSSDRHIPIYPPSAPRPVRSDNAAANAAASTLAAARMNVQRRDISGNSSVDNVVDAQVSRRSLDSDRSFPATVSIHSVRSIGSGHSSSRVSVAGSATQGYLGLGTWTGSVGAGAHTSLPSTASKPRTRFAAGSLGRRASKAATSNSSTSATNLNAQPSVGRKSFSDFFDRAHFMESISSAPSHPNASATASGRPSMSRPRPSLHLLFNPLGGGKEAEEEPIINPFHYDESYYRAQEPDRNHDSERLAAIYPSSSSSTRFTRSGTALHRANPNSAQAQAREAEMMAALDAVLPSRRGRAGTIKAGEGLPRLSVAGDRPQMSRAPHSDSSSENKTTGGQETRKQSAAFHGWGSLRKRASRLIG